MKITCLIENKTERHDLIAEHGLSLYIQTQESNILMDTGATGDFVKNAETLGIDLDEVDMCFLSHGHYDHGGGLNAFFEANAKSSVFVSPKAFGQYYHIKGEAGHYIGLGDFNDRSRFVFLDKDTKLPMGVSCFSGVTGRKIWPTTNKVLAEKTESGYIQDEFGHEQYLVIEENGRRILFSGCAHNGIINIVEKFNDIYNCYPDFVFSGFHILSKNGYSKEAVADIINTAKELDRYGTIFYTCHCTGEEPYIYLKSILGDRINYISTGDEVIL